MARKNSTNQRLNPESQATARPRCFVSLGVAGKSLDFDALSNGIGTTPTKTRLAGEKYALGTRERDEWILASPLSPETDVDEHLNWLRQRLQSHYSFLAELKDRANVWIYCGFTLTEEQNFISIAPRTLDIFQHLGVPLEITIFAVPSDDE